MTTTSTATSPISGYLADLLERFAAVDDGQVASYIPELADADPSHFGICIVTLDGAIYEAGDTRVPFTIQSMSKPLTAKFSCCWAKCSSRTKPCMMRVINSAKSRRECLPSIAT